MPRTRFIAQAGVIAALYAAMTLLVLQFPAQLGWGLVQFRVSEAVTVLALFTPAAIPGLTIGSVLANLFTLTQVGPIAFFDVVFGSLGTLLGAIWMWRLRGRLWLALLGPVVTNAIIVPAYLPAMLAGIGVTEVPFLGIGPGTAWPMVYAAGVLTVGAGQAIVLYGLGLPLALALRRIRVPGLLDTRDGTGAD